LDAAALSETRGRARAVRTIPTGPMQNARHRWAQATAEGVLRLDSEHVPQLISAGSLEDMSELELAGIRGNLDATRTEKGYCFKPGRCHARGRRSRATPARMTRRRRSSCPNSRRWSETCFSRSNSDKRAGVPIASRRMSANSD